VSMVKLCNAAASSNHKSRHLVVFCTTKVSSERVRTRTHNVTQLAVQMFTTASRRHRWRCCTVWCGVLRHRLLLLVVLSFQMLHVSLHSQITHKQQVSVFQVFNYNVYCTV